MENENIAVEEKTVEESNHEHHGKKNKKCEEKLAYIASLEVEVEELKNKNLRTLAEFQNFKKRQEEMTSNMLKYSNEKLALDIISIIDNFDRALDMDIKDTTHEYFKYFEGFKLIHKDLVNTLEKYEVKEIECINTEFDPNYHQSVMAESVEGIEPNMVTSVLQKGYTYKDRVIKPAMVKISE